MIEPTLRPNGGDFVDVRGLYLLETTAPLVSVEHRLVMDRVWEAAVTASPGGLFDGTGPPPRRTRRQPMHRPHHQTTQNGQKSNMTEPWQSPDVYLDDTVTISSCEIHPQGGPPLGRFLLKRTDQYRWYIAGHEMEDCSVLTTGAASTDTRRPGRAHAE